MRTHLRNLEISLKNTHVAIAYWAARTKNKDDTPEEYKKLQRAKRRLSVLKERINFIKTAPAKRCALPKKKQRELGMLPAL